MGQDGKGKGEAAEQPERSAISFRNDPIGESFAINAAELALQFWPVPARRVRNHGICRIDRKSVVEGTSVSVRVDLGGSSIIKKKTNMDNNIILNVTNRTIKL